MSNLSLELDFRLRQLAEPGFYQRVVTEDLYQDGFPEDEESHQGYWADPLTHTLMLKPLQLLPDFLDTPAAGDSIIRLDSFVTDAGDISSGAVKEQPVFGNPDNPWIHHNPVGPSSAFPTAPMPGAGPSLSGVDIGDDVSGIPLLSVHPPTMYIPSATMPPANSIPTPMVAGGMTNSKVIAYTAFRTEPNQALFLRWFHDDPRTGFSGLYAFYVAQYYVEIRSVVVQVWEDVSEHGNRTSWKKILTAPIFGVNQTEQPHTGSYVDLSSPYSRNHEERHLLWLPFRRNQVLLLGSNNKAALLQVNHKAKRLADGSDWDITRSDTIAYRVLTRTPGRFQVQRVKYTANTAVLLTPPFFIDYTPTISPTVTIDGEHDHGTTLSVVQSQPATYTMPTNNARFCVKPTATTGDLNTDYGIKLHMRASTDQRWSPFFYGYSVEANRVFGNSPATPVTIGDANPASSIQSVKLTSGLSPGEGRCTVELIDRNPFDAASKYYHAEYPIKLTDSVAGTVFVGITAPNEVIPFRNDATKERRVVISARDLWEVLGSTVLRGQKDYLGVGHIDAVKRLCEEGGIECATFETVAGYTPGVVSTLNSELGGSLIEKTVAQLEGKVKGAYQPHGKLTAADMIQHIAKVYSGWYFGFRLDGTPWYLPRDYFTTSSVTFSAATTGAAPHFRGPVTFRTLPPEANWIRVACGNDDDGSRLISAPWIDWASIKNPAVVNYLGRYKRELVILRGTLSCPQLNWVARRIWDQTRRRRREVEFQADWVPTLKVGQVMTVGSYGTYRLIGFNADLKRDGRHYAAYTGELLESGIGL